ncbi:MAG: CHAD domain-containing protein [Magnetococcus sp. WYHC-3]
MATPPARRQHLLLPEHSVSEAFRLILAHNLTQLEQWVPVAMAGEDIEGVHQARVALRRMRSALSLFRRAIPVELTAPWGEEMRWAASLMGAARDLDVFLSEGLAAMNGRIPLAEGETLLRQRLLQRREEAYTQVRLSLGGERYARFAGGLRTWLDNRGWFETDLPAATRVRMQKPVRPFASAVIEKRVTRVLQNGEGILELSPEALHALRIECKKLRYATEFFSGLFDPVRMAEFTKLLKGLQDLLGIMNDVAVLPALLHGVLQGSDLPTARDYAHAAIGWRAREYEEVRNQLGPRWQAFAGSLHPWLGMV